MQGRNKNACLGGGGGLLVYSCSARRISFEFQLISLKLRPYLYISTNIPFNILYNVIDEEKVFCS